MITVGPNHKVLMPIGQYSIFACSFLKLFFCICRVKKTSVQPLENEHFWVKNGRETENRSLKWNKWITFLWEIVAMELGRIE